MRPWKLVLGCAALAAFGCGTTMVTGGDGGSGGGATGGGGSGGADVCSAYRDDGGLVVELRFVNQTGQTIFLPAGCGGPEYDITYLDAPTDLDFTFDDGCFFTCAWYQENADVPVCGECKYTAIAIPPGGSHEAIWAARGLARAPDMPAECWRNPELAASGCDQVRTAPDGEYRFQATAFAECSSCACEGELQYCFNGSPSGPQALSDSVVLPHPIEDPKVDIVFGPCAFGCP